MGPPWPEKDFETLESEDGDYFGEDGEEEEEEESGPVEEPSEEPPKPIDDSHWRRCRMLLLSHQRRCVQFEEYFEAAVAERRLEQVKEQERLWRCKVAAEEALEERKRLEASQEEVLKDFEAKWRERLAENEARMAKVLRGLQRRHLRQMSPERSTGETAELSGAPKPKPYVFWGEKRLVELRKQELVLARSKRYVEAAKCQAQIRDLEAQKAKEIATKKREEEDGSAGIGAVHAEKRILEKDRLERRLQEERQRLIKTKGRELKTLLLQQQRALLALGARHRRQEWLLGGPPPKVEEKVQRDVSASRLPRPSSSTPCLLQRKATLVRPRSAAGTGSCKKLPEPVVAPTRAASAARTRPPCPRPTSAVPGGLRLMTR